ncbi:re1-silencing transcription factor-like [Limosa lapponica baueri]|uniref:Re1-silencing transcription factor-like n=1 Tax=Limosa lapponica baueri TaxID=1758121 RepID=A0A2I0UL23_LIMLA|nr:re1-silencing transcription factor-like [Limosa lapponica baueri]
MGEALPRSRNCNQPRRRRRNITPPGTSATDLRSANDGRQHMAVGLPGNGVEPKRICLPGSSWSSVAGGCPPWCGTPQSCSLQPRRRKVPPKSRKPDQRSRGNNITPHGRSLIVLASASNGVQCTATGPPGNGVQPKRVCLPGNSGTPRHGHDLALNAPRHNVQAAGVNPPTHGVWSTAANTPGSSVEPMEVDPPQDQEEPMEVDPPQDQEQPMEVDPPAQQ